MIRLSSVLLNGSSPYVIEVDSDLIGSKKLNDKIKKGLLEFGIFSLRFKIDI